MPAAVQRSTMCPSRQRLTLRFVVRAMLIIVSIGFDVDQRLREPSVDAQPGTVNISSSPSRSEPAAPG